MSKKTVKYYSQEELQDIMNTTGALSVICDDSDSEDDGQDDSLEYEVLYDSDVDEDYVPCDVQSDDDMSDVDMPPSRKKPRRTSTPKKRCRAASISAASPATTPAVFLSVAPTVSISAAPTSSISAASTSVFAAAILASAPVATTSAASTASTSAAPTSAVAAASPASAPTGQRGKTRLRVRSDDNAPSIVDFKTTTMSITSGFRWSCRPQVLSATRIAARNIIAPFTPGSTREAQSAVTPEKCFTLLFEDRIVDEIVECTNKKIDINASKYGRKTATQSQNRTSRGACTTGDCALQWLPERLPSINHRNVEPKHWPSYVPCGHVTRSL